MRLLSLAVVLLFCVLQALAAKVPNPYKVLGIPQEANDEQIKTGFKKRSKKYHPDRNTKDPRAQEKFAKIVNAYELLKDPERRNMYDMTGTDDPQAQQQQGFGGGGFGGGGFGGGFGGGGFGGLDIEDLMRQGFFQQGGQQQRGGGGGGGGQRHTFSFGGGEGIRF